MFDLRHTVMLLIYNYAAPNGQATERYKRKVLMSSFLSCKANVRIKHAKTGHGPHSSTLVVICVVRLLFVLFYVLFV